jgi:hydroxyacylglutathione hydrolase
MVLDVSVEKVGSYEVLCYLVGCPDSGEALVVDPGGPGPRLLERLKQKGWRLKWIVNTHGHADHTAANLDWAAATGAAIVMHRLDWEFFRRPEMQQLAAAEGLPPLTRVDRPVEDGQALLLGRHQGTLIHTPGHTPGSMCLYFPGHLFTGDTLFVGAAGRTDLPGGSLAALLKSLEHKLLPLPDDTIIWPGHDYGDTPTSTLGEEKGDNPYLTDFF